MTVVEITDGDTIKVEMDGRVYPLRYIGIDTPETVHPTRGVEPYGQEASIRNRELVGGKTVYLERDVSETDRFGRLLRYVWLDRETMVNAMLLAEGLAQVTTFPPDVKYADMFVRVQQKAREERRGLWSIATPTPVAGVIVVTPDFLPPTAMPASCDPAYPTVCIPSPPPDLNCPDIKHKGFRVLPPDPHRFDKDKDGVGCE